MNSPLKEVDSRIMIVIERIAICENDPSFGLEIMSFETELGQLSKVVNFFEMPKTAGIEI